MRLLKFIAVTSLIVISVLGSVFLINRNVFLSVYDNREAIQDGLDLVEMTYSLTGVVDFAAQHPQHASVVSYEINRPDQGIFFQADTMRTLGSIANFFILAEFARQVEEGVIDDAQLIPVSELDRFVLGEIKYRAHQNALRNMRREGGIERDQIALKDVAGLMMFHNSMPAADYLFYRLGPAKVRQLMTKLAGGLVEPYQPYISIYRHLIIGADDYKSYFSDIRDADRQEFIRENLDWFNHFTTDSDFEEDWQHQARTTDINFQFADERLLHNIFPKGRPDILAHLTERLAEETLLSGEISRYMQSYMDWPMADRTTRRNLSDYGAIYDSRISLLSGLDYGRPANEDRMFVQVVIFEDLPVGFWLHLSSDFIQQDYQKRLIFDPDLFQYSANSFRAARSD